MISLVSTAINLNTANLKHKKQKYQEKKIMTKTKRLRCRTLYHGCSQIYLKNGKSLQLTNIKTQALL